MRQIVVLAAGLGSRLMPVTQSRSKAMVPVLGRPLVELALTPWIGQGLTDVVFVIGPGDEEIRTHFGDGSAHGIVARFVVQRERKGMAHALSVAAECLTGDFAVTACDSLVSADHVGDLLATHRDGSTVLSLLEVPGELVSRSAAVDLEGNRVRRIVEKPKPDDAPSNTVSLPHYILPHPVLELLASLELSPRGEIELQSAIQHLIELGHPVLGALAESRHQVSDPEDLRLFNLDRLRTVDASRAFVGGAAGTGAVIDGAVRVEDGVVLGGGCRIGPDVYLESGCAIGDGVSIVDSVVLRGVRVESRARIEGRILS